VTVRVHAQAPSNIAIVKYMGKTDFKQNLPAHGSLSLTLNQLRSEARVQISESSRDEVTWSPDLFPAGHELAIPTLDDRQFEKVQRHVERMQRAMGFEQSCSVQIACGNSFPADAGIASSASSFAAMTLGLAAAFSEDGDRFQADLSQVDLRARLADWSRHRNDEMDAARKKVLELNARFSEWYYVVSDSVYQKLKISRQDLIKKKEALPTPGMPNLNPTGGLQLPQFGPRP